MPWPLDDEPVRPLPSLAQMGVESPTMANALRALPSPPSSDLSALSDAWAARGVRNFISDNPARNAMRLHDLVVPPEQRGQGLGSQFLNDLTALADKTGRTVTLTAAKDYGTTSLSRLKDFYKSAGFVENTGRNYNPAISDNMYRPPAPISQDRAIGTGILGNALQGGSFKGGWKTNE